MIFIELFFTFFKIGLFTVGGGYAMLPLIRTEVLGKGWLTAEEIVNFIAVSESTPGRSQSILQLISVLSAAGQQGQLLQRSELCFRRF